VFLDCSDDTNESLSYFALAAVTVLVRMLGASERRIVQEILDLRQISKYSNGL